MLMMVPELSLYIKVRIYTNLQAIENVQANVKCITDFFFSFSLFRFCMVYSEVPNFSEPNQELLTQGNQQNKSVGHHGQSFQH